MERHVPTYDEAVAKRHEEVEGHVESHGHSVAAWVGVGVCLVGALVGSFAVVFALVWLFWVGLAVMALSGILAIVLGRMGYGQKAAGHQSGKPSGATR